MVDTQDLMLNLSAPGEIWEVEPLKFGEAYLAFSEMVIPSQISQIVGRKV